MYEMLVGFGPFTGTDAKNLAQNLKRGNYLIPKSLNISLSCMDFIDKCLRAQPSKRMTHEQMAKHTWIINPLEEGTINLMASVAFEEPF